MSEYSRRMTLKMLPAFAALTACKPLSVERGLWRYRPDRLQDTVNTYVRMAGSLEEQQAYLQYYGEIIAIIPGAVQIPLFRLKGLVRTRWQPNPDGSYGYENYDQGLFCDWETGRVLKSFHNPITGEVNEPLHYKSGPLAATVGLAEGQFNPVSLEWRQVGDQVSATNSRIGRAFDNPVKPEEFPLASTGEKVRYSWTSTYFADARDLANDNLPSVAADHIWTFVTNYPAWMKMSGQPGSVLWRWTGRKIVQKAELDPYILAEVESQSPGFLTLDRPWPERSDGWTQYTRERQPDI